MKPGDPGWWTGPASTRELEAPNLDAGITIRNETVIFGTATHAGVTGVGRRDNITSALVREVDTGNGVVSQMSPNDTHEGTQ